MRSTSNQVDAVTAQRVSHCGRPVLVKFCDACKRLHAWPIESAGAIVPSGCVVPASPLWGQNVIVQERRS